MLLATVIWSVVAALTFALARRMQAYDYRAFFEGLLGPGWIAFEIAYLIFVVLILAVFGAAAGAIGAATFGWPELAGSVLLALAILGFTAFGTALVETLFKYASMRSEEHTSELQSLMRISYAVFCLKKKNIKSTITI